MPRYGAGWRGATFIAFMSACTRSGTRTSPTAQTVDEPAQATPTTGVTSSATPSASAAPSPTDTDTASPAPAAHRKITLAITVTHGVSWVQVARPSGHVFVSGLVRRGH